MINVITKARSSVRELGLPNALILLLGRTLATISFQRLLVRRFYLFHQPLASIPSFPVRRGASVIVRQVQRDDEIIARFPRPIDEVQARFEAGAECLAAEVDGKLAGFLWFAIGSCTDPDTNIRFKLHPAATNAWDFDLFVADQFRSTAVFYKLWSHCAEVLTERGINASTSLVWAHNVESVRSHRRLGAFIVGGAVFVRGSGWSLCVANRAPRFRLFRDDSARLEYEVELPDSG